MPTSAENLAEDWLRGISSDRPNGAESVRFRARYRVAVVLMNGFTNTPHDASIVATLERFPLQWTQHPRGDGLVNLYCGTTAVALCVRPDVARLILAAVEHFAEDVA